jgi:hypothetical protein
MDVIHFTHGATDSLFMADVRFVPLLEGSGNSHIGCAHFQPGDWMRGPAIGHAGAGLVVHGRVAVTLQASGALIHLYAAMGGVFSPGEACVMRAETVCIVLIVEAAEFSAHDCGISHPLRIAGQTWPSDQLLTGRAI